MRWIMLGLTAAVAVMGFVVLSPAEKGESRSYRPTVEAQPDALAAGESYVLALDGRGRVFGWGSARRRGGAVAPLSTSKRPRLLLEGEGYRQVSAGSRAIYALHASGTLWRWSIDDVLDGAAANALPKPMPVAPDLRWKKAFETWGVGAGIRADGSLWYWQDEGLEDQTSQATTALMLRAPHQLMPGTRFVDACLEGSRLHAIDESGQLWRTAHLHGRSGRQGPHQGERSDMQALSAGGRLRQVYCRENASQVFALDEQGRLHGYGFNSFGELGVGEPDYRYRNRDAWKATSLQPIPGGPWATVAVSHSFSLGIQRDGSLWGWGRNLDRELGMGATGAVHHPALIDDSRRWLAVAATYGAGIALTSSGESYAWGSNGSGALGDGGIAKTHDRPTAVLTDERFGASP